MKVKLKIKTSQYLDGSDFQTIESYYKGEQIEKNGNIYITFSEFDTSKERSSTIKISDAVLWGRFFCAFSYAIMRTYTEYSRRYI